MFIELLPRSDGWGWEYGNYWKHRPLTPAGVEVAQHTVTHSAAQLILIKCLLYARHGAMRVQVPPRPGAQDGAEWT